MLITYIRSSSLGTYEFCPMQYYFVYELGMTNKQNAKATMGSVMHKNLELLGKAQIARQKKKKTFKDEEFGTIKISDITLDYLNDISFNYYDKAYPNLMSKNDKKTTLQWTEKSISNLDGQLHPYNQNIHAVEEFFEIDIPHEWASFEYCVNGKTISGQLGIKGTVDLIVKEDDIYFHVIDYKSGRRMNWATMEIKTYDLLSEDKQLLLYYYALRMKYPDKKFYISIYYVNDYVIDKVNVPGGLFTFAFGESDFQKAEQMLRRQFEKIRNDINPNQISTTCSNFKCKHMCAFSQIIPSISMTTPACIHIKKEIEANGIRATTEKYANFDKLTKYDGGGRLGVELKE